MPPPSNTPERCDSGRSRNITHRKRPAVRITGRSQVEVHPLLSVLVDVDSMASAKDEALLEKALCERCTERSSTATHVTVTHSDVCRLSAYWRPVVTSKVMPFFLSEMSVLLLHRCRSGLVELLHSCLTTAASHGSHSRALRSWSRM